MTERVERRHPLGWHRLLGIDSVAIPILGAAALNFDGEIFLKVLNYLQSAKNLRASIGGGNMGPSSSGGRIICRHTGCYVLGGGGSAAGDGFCYLRFMGFEQDN
jgi:hypothetical protein